MYEGKQNEKKYEYLCVYIICMCNATTFNSVIIFGARYPTVKIHDARLSRNYAINTANVRDDVTNTEIKLFEHCRNYSVSILRAAVASFFFLPLFIVEALYAHSALLNGPIMCLLKPFYDPAPTPMKKNHVL